VTEGMAGKLRARSRELGASRGLATDSANGIWTNTCAQFCLDPELFVRTGGRVALFLVGVKSEEWSRQGL
jgi:hypothetical protein